MRRQSARLTTSLHPAGGKSRKLLEGCCFGSISVNKSASWVKKRIEEVIEMLIRNSVHKAKYLNNDLRTKSQLAEV